MKDKLRLDYFLSVGGKLAKGDECYNIEYKEPNAFKEVVQKGDAFAGQLRFSGEGYGIYGKGDLKHLVITSFTDRENKGVQPVPDDFPVLIKFECDLGLSLKVCRKPQALRWGKQGTDMDIKSWKPYYEALLKMQAEYDLNNFKDTMNHKQKVFKRTPIYTQEMKDNGELPKVGMLCDIKDRGRIWSCNAKISYISRFVVCFEIDSEELHLNLDDVLFVPIKTPEEIEQENKIKDIHSKLLQNGFEVELSAVKFLNKNYIITDK